MSKYPNLYDLYKRANGLLYRVPLYSPLHKHAEMYNKHSQQWLLSHHKIGGVISSKGSTLVAHNVVFKGRLC